ncbi:unnamed protein product [Polarella glacialis]|jgi:carbonic anhydrase|uniref:carbonic anhydrase n=2 Tax=Polarella glacialis TaxID=89957 RepID=A0A813HJC7_POLGL|nr:unnamed protein product [Polarella glacialis]CAE8637839.1 unnamed protein product [Polarella glacialis]CAE8637840.1 unnamed protein product [Polarella glacialis]CAE8681367.1 unnamed protein product [Polarella glacialis]CAE8724839.1 unnamed protein product [Polarella glacialis]
MAMTLRGVALLLLPSMVLAAAPAVDMAYTGGGRAACDESVLLQVKQQKHSEQCVNVSIEIYPYGTKQESKWGTSYTGWETCIGFEQSPIDICTRDTRVQHGAPLNQDYASATGLYVENNGHNLKVKGDFGSVIIGGEKFEAKQFHFHSPGEHQIDGHLSVAEMHIVNLNENGTAAAVVGVLFKLGQKNMCLETVLAANMPRAGCKTFIGDLDLGCFGTQLKGPYWSYQGSLTTPPCSEIVKWNVLKRHATISQGQLKVLAQRFSFALGNNRDVQKLYHRSVTLTVPVY